MKALEAQRQKPAETTGAASAQGGGQANGTMTAAQKRDQQLEERRRKFFDKSSVESSNVPEKNYNGFSSVAEPAAITFQVAGLPKPKPVETEIRPSDWKSKGYPSEYAYMKAAGQLNIPSKPAVEIAPLSSHPFPYGASLVLSLVIS